MLRFRRLASVLVVAGTLTGGLAAVTAVSGPASAQAATSASTDCPWTDPGLPVATRVSELMAKMTTGDKISMVHGSVGSYAGNVAAIPSLCVPSLTLEDGPAGVGDNLTGVTQLPAPVDAAATWDPADTQQYGAVIGAEDKGKGVDVDLGPTVNIVRDPRWGRAFEALGEDPYLTGQLGASEIQGIQGQGVMAQVKHLAVYNQETNRNTPLDNAIVSERTMQEIYLPAFSDAVNAGVASVMCAYSTVNGVDACENPYLQKQVLRDQFGFGGFVTSDWLGTHSTVPAAKSGLDMEMPGALDYGLTLEAAVADGQVPQSTLNTMVSDILTQMFKFGLFDSSDTGSSTATVTSPGHQATARDIAEQGTVLLKNSGDALPLDTATTKSIAVIGADASAAAQTSGGGSSAVTSSGTVTPLQAITSRAGSGVTVNDADGSSLNPVGQAVAAARKSDVAVVFASDYETESSDLTSINLPGGQNQLISAVAAANPNTIVVLNTGSAVTMPWLNQVKGVLEAWYPGQEDGNAIASVLFGDTDPSGHLPVTFPKSLSDVPASTPAQWPGTNGQVQYSEGLDVGYRWYDAKGIAPLFPFGYGLSYTSFSYSGIRASGPASDGTVTVTADVTNTGQRAGADVAQLYVGDPAAAGEPPQQLKGFDKVSLNPGETKQVTFTLPVAKDFSYWDSTAHAWTVAPGTYTIGVGDSSASLPLQTTVDISG